MTYFSLRKHTSEPEPEPLEEVAEEAPEEEPEAAPPAGALSGVPRWFSWSTRRFGAGMTYGVHAVAVWACFFYGGMVAITVIVVFVLAVAGFTPREQIDRLVAWIEKHDRGMVQEEPDGEQPENPREAFARWLLHTIGERPGIHLKELYPAMRGLPGQERRTDAELRARLKALGVTVDRSVRIGRVAGRSGVYRHHVEALLPSRGERPVDSSGDAGQAPDSPPLSGVGEGA